VADEARVGSEAGLMNERFSDWSYGTVVLKKRQNPVAESTKLLKPWQDKKAKSQPWAGTRRAS